MASSLPRRDTVGARNFHVPLPEPLYRALREAAERQGRAATILAREAIEAWLHDQEKSVLREAIASYARGAAGTRSDLDPELESAAIEALERPKRGRRR